MFLLKKIHFTRMSFPSERIKNVLIRFASFICPTETEKERSHFEMMCFFVSCHHFTGHMVAYATGNEKPVKNAEAVARLFHVHMNRLWRKMCVCQKRNVQEISISCFYHSHILFGPFYRNLFHMFIILHALMCFAAASLFFSVDTFDVSLKQTCLK